jgi:hypothetical protein
VVERVELYDDHRDAGSADACVAFEREHGSVNLTDPELGRGNGCDIV